MKTYILNCDEINFFETFKSMEAVIEQLTILNNKLYDGGIFSLFGDDGDNPYIIDSAIFPVNGGKYHTFYIHAIDEKGNITTLN